MAILAHWRERWNRRLLQFLGRRVRSAVDIQDLAQETYLRLLRAPDLRAVRDPQAYMLRVASHVIAEWRQDNAPTEPISSVDGMLVDECLPELDLDAGLARDRLDQALGGMSAAMRATVLLRLRDRHSYKQIAAELQLTPRQVRRYLERGYDLLRCAIEG